MNARRLAGALALAGLLAAALGLLGGTLRGGRPGNALAAPGAASPPTAGDQPQPELGLPAREVVVFGAATGEAPGQRSVWAYGKLGPVPVQVGGRSYSEQYALLENTESAESTESAGWQVVPLPEAPGGKGPLAPAGEGPSPAQYGALAGQTTPSGGVVLLSGQSVVLRDPGAQPTLVPPPSTERSEGAGESEGGSGSKKSEGGGSSPQAGGESEPEPPPGEMLAPGELLLPPQSRGRGPVAVTYAAIEDGSRTGVLIAPYDDGGDSAKTPTVRPGVLHYDGSSWTREPIALAPQDRERFGVLALACAPSQACWLLASSQTAGKTSLLLFERVSASASPSGHEWKPAASSAWPFGEQLPAGIGPATPVLALAPGAAMLTATSQGVWVDFQALLNPAPPGERQEYSDVSELVLSSGGRALGPWCYPTGPGCAGTLGAGLPAQYRSFAWPGAGEDAGTRIIAGLSDHAMLELAGGRFTYQIGPGGQVGQAPGGAAFVPSSSSPSQVEGWIADNAGSWAIDQSGQAQVVRLTGHPQGDELGAEAVPFRRPLYALAQAPDTTPGAPGAQSVAVGELGQIARYTPGSGWRPEALYGSSGAVQTPTLRGVAWPEPGRIYAVGDEGAMWLWREETGLWEPDPAAPLNFVGNLQAIAFSSTDPELGYAVGRQGVILRYGKTWEQAPAEEVARLEREAGVESPLNFTSIAFAGGEAIATYRTLAIPPGGSKFNSYETGGVIVEEVGDGMHWHVDQGVSALLAQLPRSKRVLSKAAGLPDGGAVLAGPGKVIERDSASSGWRFSSEPLPEAQNISALAAYREAEGPVRALVSIDLDELVNPEFYPDGDLESTPFKIDLPLITAPGQPTAFLGPDLIPNSGYLLRETADGWTDLEHDALPAGCGRLPCDMPVRPDPVLALLSAPSGASALAVGGQTDDLVGEGVGTGHPNNLAAQTAAAMRFPAAAASSNGTALAPIRTPPAQASFVVAGQAACVRSCAGLADERIGPDIWLQHALQTANRIASESGGGLRGFLYTGGRLAPGELQEEAVHGGEALERFEGELGRYAQLLGSGGPLPVYLAASEDLTSVGVAPFESVLGSFTPEAAPGHAYYAVASKGGASGGEVLLIVLSFQHGELEPSAKPGENSELEWLQGELAAAKLAHLPAIVMGNDSLGFALPHGGGSGDQVVKDAADSTAVAATLVQGEASAYFFDYPGANVKSAVSYGGKSIPAYGTGTLGYVSPGDEVFEADSLGSSGFLLASVDPTVHPDREMPSVVAVSATVIPNISELALDATDGVLLRRSQVALFNALARRPPGGVAVYEGNNIEVVGPDPYDPIPFDCQGSDCVDEVPLEHTFSSSNPEVGDFVAHEGASNNPRQVQLGSNRLPVPDAQSGLFCAYNEGTTIVSITTGGLTYSEPVTVQGGSVEYPCGTVPLKRKPAKPVSDSLHISPLGPPLGSGPNPKPYFPYIKAPPAPRAQPKPAPRRQRRPPAARPFLAVPALIVPILAITPPPPAPTPRPTPPSGTAEVPAQSPVSQPIGVTEDEKETQAVTEHVHNAVAYSHDDRPPLPAWPLALVLVLAVAGVALRSNAGARERAYARSRADRCDLPWV